MYRLWNKLFGWDYIYWWNTCDSGVARVFRNEGGKGTTGFYCRYKNIQVYDIIKEQKQVLWLTCSADKYVKNKQ